MSVEELASPKRVVADSHVSIVGVGGAGNNLLSHAIGNGLSPSHCVAVNTDRLELSRSPASNKVLLEVDGSGFSNSLADGRKDLQLSIRRVVPFTDASELTIVVAGLGGETGTGAAPLIAQWSRSRIRPVVSVVALPFIHERERRLFAVRGLKKMAEACDCTIVIDNSQDNRVLNSRSRTGDELVSTIVADLTNLGRRMTPVQKLRLQNALSLGPIATLSIAHAKSQESIQSAVVEAVSTPSAQLPVSGALGAIMVYSGPDSLSEAHAAMAYDALSSIAGHNLDFLYGSVERDDEPRICILLTGYDYGTAVRAFVEYIEDLYDLEYGEESFEASLHLEVPLFQMERR